MSPSVLRRWAGWQSFGTLLLAFCLVDHCRGVERQSLGDWQEDSVLEKMEQQHDWAYVETPLSDVIEHFRLTCKMNFQLDTKSLEEVGVGSDVPVTFQAKNISAAIALKHLLRPLELIWTVQDGIVYVTTPEVAEVHLSTRIYNVRDLLARTIQNGQSTYDFDSLIEIITGTIAPNTWDGVGGPGSIGEYTNGVDVALVISQTLEVHLEIDALLAKLRHLPQNPARSHKQQPSVRPESTERGIRETAQPRTTQPTTGKQVRRTTLAPAWPPVAGTP